MNCPDCEEVLRIEQGSYGHVLYVCKVCGYAEEMPDRNKKPKKMKTWKDQSGT